MNATGVESSGRRVRITLRCLTEDLGEKIPLDTVDLGQIDHPLLEEARRLAPTAPEGQKRITAIDPPPLVFRLRHGQFRGAAWVDETARPAQIFWVVAAALRREGDRDDAFRHFARLYKAHRLLPEPDDDLRLRVESTARVLDTSRSDLKELLSTAYQAPNQEHSAILGGCVPTRAFREICEGYDAFWIAQEVRMTNGTMVPTSLREILFAIAQNVLGADDADAVYAWPTGEVLSGHEIARLYVRGR